MTSYSFVERLAELTKAGEHRTKTHTHHLCPCDVCGEWTLLPTHRVGLKCRMTPRCGGRHRKVEIIEIKEIQVVTTEYTRVLAAVREAATMYTEFSTDDVWPLLDFTPTERNIVGKAFSEANRLGLIEGTERFIRSQRPEAKGRRVQVWRATRTPNPFADLGAS